MVCNELQLPICCCIGSSLILHIPICMFHLLKYTSRSPEDNSNKENMNNQTNSKLGEVAQMFNPSSWEAEAEAEVGGSLWVWSQPGLETNTTWWDLLSNKKIPRGHNLSLYIFFPKVPCKKCVWCCLYSYAEFCTPRSNCPLMRRFSRTRRSSWIPALVV